MNDWIGAFAIWTPVIGLLLTIAFKRPQKYKKAAPLLYLVAAILFMFVQAFGAGWAAAMICDDPCEEPRIWFISLIIVGIGVAILLISYLADEDDPTHDHEESSREPTSNRSPE